MTHSVLIDVIQDADHPERTSYYSASVQLGSRKFLEVDSTVEGAIESLRRAVDYDRKVRVLPKPEGFPKLVEVDLT